LVALLRNTSIGELKGSLHLLLLLLLLFLIISVDYTICRSHQIHNQLLELLCASIQGLIHHRYQDRRLEYNKNNTMGTLLLFSRQMRALSLCTTSSFTNNASSAAISCNYSYSTFSCNKNHIYYRQYKQLKQQRPQVYYARTTRALLSSSSSDRTGEEEEKEEGTSSQIQLQQKLPVGIFVDLDNIDIDPKRSSIKSFVEPLRRVVKSFGGEISTFEAFANRSTQTWKSRPSDSDDDDDDGDGEDDNWIPWDGTKAQTGRDGEGNLRCGICGSKMKLTKKDKSKGWTEYDKLNKHMKMLHDREQSKRINRAKQTKKKKKLTAKESERFQKYKSAQVGLSRLSGNDLFRILNEHKVRCFSVENVDEHLIKHSKKWKSSTVKNNNGNNARPRGALMVVSEDSDFCPLLEQSRSSGMVAISVTLNDQQTNKVRNASDVCITFNGITGKLQWESLSNRGGYLEEKLLEN